MNRIETTLGLTSIISLLICLGLREYFQEELPIFIYLLLISTNASLILNLYMLRSAKISLMWFMILLFSCMWIAMTFKVFHLPGANLLMIFSYLIYLPILGITFLTIGFKSPKSTKLHLLITGTLLVIHVLTPLVFQAWNQNIPRMIVNYVLVAATFTAVIKYPSQKLFEKRLMILLLIYSSMNMLITIFN